MAAALLVMHCRPNASRLDEGKVRPLPVRDLTVPVDELEAHLKPDSSQSAFASPRPIDVQVFEQIIPGLVHLSDPADPELERWNGLAHEIGYTLERWHVSGDIYAVLREQPDRLRGGGTYVFRVIRARPGQARASGQARKTSGAVVRPAILLQAPHIYFDVGTAPIAIHAFFTARQRRSIRALYMNSMHRYQTGPGTRKEGERSRADASHNPRHLLNTATRLAADQLAPLHVLQLHGFGKRVAASDGARVDLVVSAGDHALTDAVASSLQQSFQKREVRRYPDEFSELGGASNVQRKLLDGYPRAAFIHLEMSRSFRKYVLRKETRGDRFLVSLIEGTTAGDGLHRSQP